MKKTLLLLLLVVIRGYAQEEKSKPINAFYAAGSLEVGNHLGFDVSVNYIYKNKYSFSLGRLGMLYGSDNYPSDKDDTDGLGFEGIDDAGHIYFSIGRIIEIKNSDKFRFNLSMGLARTSGYREYNYTRGEKTNNGYYYNSEFEDYHIYSVILNPKFEFVKFSASGLYISPKVILNKKKSFYGVGLGLMLGRVR
ncbi:hypothetical protein FHR24_000035 [Wenyingzhuangia heitensis]|uniref:Outer membrane protein beta-barrel domain-containing protein n=1 Tax=Wenyingzhuangia heitensis TaxID=1487859 RepID=A0ABX0U7J0_9FLAO|nr:hypothetical protein [Wenyingzhuangia heitensis]NIJ43596.1 hypothetical protein [Wenyingzhuangia heitensis]